MHTIFVTVVNRADNPFSGFISDLEPSEYDEVFLTPELYVLVERIEYSWRRFFRPFYYAKVFSELSKQIESVVKAKSYARDIRVFSSDEGVWGIFLRGLRDQLSKKYRKRIRLYNVQHGFFDINQEKNKRKNINFLKAMNKICRWIFGFPAFGLGFGGSKQDRYYVYDDESRNYLRWLSDSLEVKVAPQKIKHGLISKYTALRQFKTNEDRQKRIAYFLPHFNPDPHWKVDQFDFFSEHRDLFMALRSAGFWLLFRPHPGMPKKDWEAVWESQGLESFGEYDNRTPPHEIFAGVCAVIAINSTALFEAYILGLTAVKIDSKYDQTELNFDHITLPLNHLKIERSMKILLNSL